MGGKGGGNDIILFQLKTFLREYCEKQSLNAVYQSGRQYIYVIEIFASVFMNGVILFKDMAGGKASDSGPTRGSVR